MKRSNEVFEHAQHLIHEYHKEGWPSQDKHSIAHQRMLGFMRAEFINLALDVAESSDETLDLIIKINEQFGDWINHNDCPALMKGSSGNLAYIFEPLEEYEYRNPLIDALVKYYQDNGLPKLLTVDLESMANNMPGAHAMALDQLSNDWPDFYSAIHQLQNSYRDVAIFFRDYNATHHIVDNPSGAMYEENQ